jgi:MFS family permease
MIIGSLFTTLFICMIPFTNSYSILFIVAFLFYFSLNFYQGPYTSLIPESVDANQLGLANGFSRVVSVLGMALIFVTGTTLWNINHALPFLLAAALALCSVLVTVLFVKENPSKYEKPTRLSFDFLKYPSAMKLFFSVFFIFLGYGCITPFYIKYCVNILKFTEGTASTGLLVLTLVGAAFAYPIGLLVDKIEKRKVMLLGVVILTICLAIAPLVSTIFQMNIMFSFFGVGFIAIQITSYSIVAEIVPPERLGEFMGILNMFISLSQFLANNIMGNILDRFGFSLFFRAPCVAMFIAAVIIFFSRFDKYKVKA